MQGRSFRNRGEVGRLLAEKLARHADRSDVIVLALSRGGVPVAFEIAQALNAPLDIFLVENLEVEVGDHDDLDMGAVASGDVRILNRDLIRELNISETVVEAAVRKASFSLWNREIEYRDNRPAFNARGKIAILVDDGLSTESTLKNSIKALRRQKPSRLVLAMPIAAPLVCEDFQEIVDEVVCARTPDPFHAAGVWYEDFSRTTDGHVRDLLARVSIEAINVA